MRKLKSILVVFNGSDTGNGTLKQVLKLARDGNCEVAVAILLPSHNGKPVLVGIRSVREAFRRSRKEASTGSSTTVVEQEGTQIQTILEDNNVHEAIISAAKERGCDLIIIGRRGHKKQQRSFMESVTARVIGHSPIDVLVIPKDSVLGWDNILLATDGSKCSELATKRALDISRNFKGRLRVVSVVNVPEEAYGESPNMIEKLIYRAKDIIEPVRVQAESLSINIETFIKEGKPHEKIVELAQELNVDVICLGTYGRTGLKRIFMGSVTEKVIRKTSCPVRVVKAC